MAKSQQAATTKALQWTHKSGPQPCNWHVCSSGLSRGWEDFGLTIITFPRHIINQLVYYFVVRCVTFTMQTEIPMSAQEQCIFFLEAVTWKTRLLSGYLANTESKQREANLKTSTFPWGQPSLQRVHWLFPLRLALAEHCQQTCPMALQSASLA